MVLTEFEVEIALVCNDFRVVYGFREILKQSPHLLFTLEIEFVARISHAVLVIQDRAGLDAKKDVMGLPVRLVHIVDVVGSHDGQAEFISQSQLVGSDGLLIVQSVILQFQIEITLPKDIQ